MSDMLDVLCADFESDLMDDRNQDGGHGHRDDPPRNVADLFGRAGYDIYDFRSMQDFTDDLAWAHAKRKAEMEQPKRWFQVLLGTFLTSLTVLMTLIGQWAYAKITGGH